MIFTPPPLTFFLVVRLSWNFFLNFGNEKNSSKNIFWYFSDPYDVTYDEITYFSNVKFRVFSSFSFLTFLKKNFRWNVIHEIVALHNTHLGKIIRRSGKIANLVKWRHLWRHNDVISVCFYNFILYLCYFWTDWDHSYTKMTGLMSTFQKKIVSGHDVTDDVINVIYDVISASKLENAITLLFFNRFGQSIHQNHGIEMNFPKNWKKIMQQP